MSVCIISQKFINNYTLYDNVDVDDTNQSLLFFSQHLVALSPNAFLYVWDIETQQRVSTIRLPYEYENVCLTLHKEKGLYAIGSQSDVSFMDLRSDKNVSNIKTQDIGAGRYMYFQKMLQPKQSP